MFSSLHTRIKLSGKAALLLGVYLLHFILFQSFVADFSNTHYFSTKTFFSGTHKNSSPNSGIATFRTLEKHESSYQAFRLSPDFPVFISKTINIARLIDKPVRQASITTPFHCSDVSYRLYVRDCVFLI